MKKLDDLKRESLIGRMVLDEKNKIRVVEKEQAKPLKMEKVTVFRNCKGKVDENIMTESTPTTQMRTTNYQESPLKLSQNNTRSLRSGAFGSMDCQS